MPRAPPSPALPHKLRGGGRIRVRVEQVGARPGLPCTPPPKLGEGSTASRGTSERAVGGEGSRRSAPTVSPAPAVAPPPGPLPARSSRRGGEPRPAMRRPERTSGCLAPLPRSWGRGRPPLRGTSKKAVGGEGSRRSARQSAPTLDIFALPHSRTPALTHFPNAEARPENRRRVHDIGDRMRRPTRGCVCGGEPSWARRRTPRAPC
jgi:hypothetical protein